MHMTYMQAQQISIALGAAMALIQFFHDPYRVVPGFEMYDRLSHYQRSDLVQSASSCLSAWMANPTLTTQQTSSSPLTTQQTSSSPLTTQAAASSSVSASDQQQLENRRRSSMSASTSQAGSGPTASSSSAATGVKHSSSTGKQLSGSLQTPTPIAPKAAATAADHSMPADSVPAVPHALIQGGRAHKSPSDHIEADSPLADASIASLQLSTEAVKVLGEEPSVDLLQQSFPSSAMESPARHLTAASPSSNGLPDSDNSTEHATRHLVHPLDSLTERTKTDVSPDTDMFTQQMDSSSISSSGLGGSPSLSALPDEIISDPHQPDDLSQQAQPEHSEGKKAVKPETLAFRATFALSAAAAESADGKVDFEAGGQRSEEWFALRQSRLTASAFSNALG